jgi:hypothetical protein
MGAFGRSYRMFHESLAVLRQDKALLLFPMLSGVFSLIALAGFVCAAWITGFFAAITAGAPDAPLTMKQQVIGYGGLFVWYFVSWSIVIFFNVAIIHCAKLRFEGQTPTASDGIQCAMKHLPRILAWAAVSATVGLVLQVIEEKGKIVGTIVKALLGAAWAICTFFIVPVIIYENMSIWASFKRSSQLIYNCWGTAAVSGSGIGFFIFLLALPAFAFPIGGAVVNPQWGLMLGLALMMVWFVFLGCVSSALSGIMRAALYNYASTGSVPVAMSKDVFENAFKSKK